MAVTTAMGCFSAVTAAVNPVCQSCLSVCVCVCVCRGRGILYRYQLQGYAKLVEVLKVILFALLLNGVSSSTSLAQVTLESLSRISTPLHPILLPCASWPPLHPMYHPQLRDPKQGLTAEFP